MRLKRIELCGFKSFPTRTTLDLNSGITVVVGPNGCGKSNLADAIRWVLGEHKTSVLRSSRMEDVIFNGTEGRRPLNMAEVNLVIDNSDGTLPVEFSEVCVTRRFFRADDLHQRSRHEVPFHLSHSHRQQALTPMQKRLAGALVDHHPPLAAAAVSDPTLAP